MSSPATTKQLDSVALLLKQTMTPTPSIQVISQECHSNQIFLFAFIDGSNSSRKSNEISSRADLS